MIRIKLILLFITVFMLSVHCPLYVLGAETNKNLVISEPKNFVKIIRPSDSASVNLKNIKRMTVLVTSNSPLFGGLAEEQLSLKLRDAGYDVVPRSKITDFTQVELMKEEIKKLEEDLKILKEQTEVDKQFEKSGESARALKKIDIQLQQLRRMGENPQKGMVDLVGIGKKLRLDAVVFCTLFEGKRQFGFPDDKPPLSMEKEVVSTFFLQVMNISTENSVLGIMLEYDKGENVTTAIDTIIKYLMEEIKR